jgi:hypothetical protein
MCGGRLDVLALGFWKVGREVVVFLYADRVMLDLLSRVKEAYCSHFEVLNHGLYHSLVKPRKERSRDQDAFAFVQCKSSQVVERVVIMRCTKGG